MKQFTLNRPPSSGKSMHGGQGFTLVELMVIVVIAAVLLAAAIPSFENLLYASSGNRAADELVGTLKMARMKAIKSNGDVTVAFNQPSPNQVSISWNENGARQIVNNLNRKTNRVQFDFAPPGGVAAPDPDFVFTSMGFIEPGLGAATGNIYLVDTRNNRRFRISTTVGGGIIEQKWNGSTWLGPSVTIVP